MSVLIQNILAWGIAVVLFLWTLITMLNQSRRTRKWVRPIVGYDVCGLIPIWTFFAPNPGDTDTHLLYRDRDRDGRVTAWRDVRLVRRDRVTDLWDPRRRISKGVVDVVFDLARPDVYDGEPGPKPVSKQRVLSFPYLLVLNYVSRLRGDFGAVERQFAVAKTRGAAALDQPDILLVSAFHQLS